ncbi:UNHEALTHY RIBOSOME BIOGENESIS PROTEIN 2-like protein [Salix purpurea]|uniref:UNHEALTHY RIBOSOME BIOGENESIS PROTEIN 2-like protein n=1 Tax=Salix purpurea TaxID=77065 RepID=A0A9Q0WFV3_SALPP|nr:UNHEALTHY RIBOSOME BIOGENESIS PROTEIN 2-like protein [Salix purpurea]
MADSSDLSIKKVKKKRTLSRNEEKQQKPSKINRIDHDSAKEKGSKQEVEEVASPWRNLQLILSIQNREIHLQKKVELAYDFVNSREKGGGKDADVDRETVKVSRVVAFLNDWVQSLLISTDKKIEVGREGIIEACLDCRCWVIFKFCLEESLRLQVSLSFSRNLLRAIGIVARNVLSVLTAPSVRLQESVFTGAGLELHSVVLDCVSLVFLSHGGLSNENLDLWILSILPVLEFVNKVYDEKLEGGNVGVFALRFSCLVLEPFAKFLRVHPTRKNGFRDFVDKLLEPLLHLLGVLHLQSDASNPGWTRNLLVSVEEVLSQGLFHPTHIDGFLSLRVAEKYSASNDGEKKESKNVIQSYHRHFFDKLERIILAKKEYVLSGLGELFHLLVDCVKKQKETLVLSEDMKIVERTEGSRHLSGQLSKTLHGSSTPLDTSYRPSILSAEKRKSLFNFFVQITDPLLPEMNGYLQSELAVGPLLLDVHCTIKYINNLLACFLREKLYIKTEDMSEGACLNFLKKVYNAILPFTANLLCLPTYNVDSQTQETLTLLARELLASVRHLLDIEYEVIENDLTRLWFIMLSCLAFGHSYKDAPNACSLTSQILGLGCQLVKLYSELRQVKSTIFALCKATRLLIAHDNGGEAELNYDSLGLCKISLPHASYAKAVEMLFCSHEFKLAIRNDIYSTPEGQASECIQHLTADLSESMEWMKTTCSLADEEVFGESNANSSMHVFDLQVELFGRGLSEIYVLVLDSLNVTAGNSSIVGRTMKDLMAVIRPYMSILVGTESESVNAFISSVTGRSSDVRLAGNTQDMLRFVVSTHWILVFFSRMYMSCRSLYRQAVSLMPPDVSRKMSVVMGDPFTAYSARDWMDKTDWADGGYFSWILQPSASLPVIIQSVSDIYLQGDIADCCSLIYVLLTMALQRLVDLNRQIKSLEYLQQRNDNTVQFKLLDDGGSSLYSKRSRKWGKHIAIFKQEGTDLTEFLMSYLSLLGNEQLPFNSSNAATCVDTCNQALHGSDKWVFGVSSVNEKSLPAAIWWIICQNIDIWSPHASKKKLKMFIKHVILTSLPSMTKGCTQVERHLTNEAHFLDRISVHQISAELLADSVLYEHKFVRRHLASRFCNLLEKSILPLFGDVKLNMSPRWKEGLSALENTDVVSGRKSSTCDDLARGKPPSHLLSAMPADICREAISVKFTDCQSLLRLFCWMPKGCINSKSFSLYVTCTLNLERLVIDHLLECGDPFFSHKQYELLRLLVACRRALKCSIMAYCEEKVRTTQCALIPVLSEDVHSVLWLSRSLSVVLRLQETLSEDKDCEAADMIFSLMDHTSYVFLTLSKYQCPSAVSVIAEKPEQLNSDVTQEQSSVNESVSCLDTTNDIESWKSVLLIAESLKEQAQDLIISLKDALCREKLSDEIDVDWNRLSSMVSCFSGFMWGLASALDHSNATDRDYKAKLLRWKCEVISKISHCINAFADFICFTFHKLFVKDDLQQQYCWNILEHLSVAGNFVKSDDCDSSLVGDSWQVTVNKHSSQSENATSIAGILSKLDSYECPPLIKERLQSFLDGDHPKAAVFIRQLLIAASAIVKLNLQTKCTPSLSSLVPSFTGISEVLLLKLADGIQVPKPFSFVWLDGALKYLQELGSHFPITNPTLTRNLFSNILELHLKALGKCISLQGKEATLASHDKELSTNTLHIHIGSASLSHLYYLDEFKARLRMSFRSLIRKPSELHLLSAIQTIERALVGVCEGCPIFYEIITGNVDGGKVSSTVAAGIDCLDLVLEYISGRKRLSVVKKNIQSLVAALFNIVLHLQSPLIFYQIAMVSERYNAPDPGAVILMCVEVLTRVSGKHALFQMDSWHVAQSLHIPAALFQDFDQLRISQDPASSNSLLNSDNQDCNTLGGMNCRTVDLKFSVELYTACCQLLYTILKHHKRESERCISLLQESERVLLHCLEMVDVDLPVRKGYFSWGVPEGVKCACSFRRIYEELRQQKDVFGQHCFKFLSNYISVYSGNGPLKTGIRREIDEALRPGVYALIDSCSADDLQYLHSVFGEGPCRNTLATLQHDYKLHFQYEGKV